MLVVSDASSTCEQTAIRLADEHIRPSYSPPPSLRRQTATASATTTTGSEHVAATSLELERVLPPSGERHSPPQPAPASPPPHAVAELGYLLARAHCSCRGHYHHYNHPYSASSYACRTAACNCAECRHDFGVLYPCYDRMLVLAYRKEGTACHFYFFDVD